MIMTKKMLAGAAGVAALAVAAPAAAQYYPGYSYGAPYGNAYGYYANNPQMLAQQCSAAVQQRLAYRGNSGSILGALFGVNTATQGRVLTVTRVTPNRSAVRVRGLATSGRQMAYNPYGVGAYGAYGYSYQPDLSFKCDIDYRGVIRDIDINRR
ncbi:MAG TPA: hypothetical protein VFK50_04125 [Sphingomicrobium sp.]|nr:hypothetical protein [Sphingomicrobium sp.]